MLMLSSSITACTTSTAQSNSKTWTPNTHVSNKDERQSRTTKVQCWGTTSKHQRCKRMIDPKNPGDAIMDGGGVYYCYQHAYQAQK